jgi:hypothetical protein
VESHASFEAIGQTLRLASSTLRQAAIPFVLGGSLAAWARGGPEPRNDLDLMVRPEDAEAALEALAAAGMRPERPPEEWLLKAWHDGVQLDLIFRPSGLEMTEEVFERSQEISVLAVGTPVMALEDVFTTKLLSLDEHLLDYTQLLAMARALREQIDWPALAARTAGSPYAAAFFTLVRELGIADPQQRGAPPAGAHPGQLRAAPAGVVRVLPDLAE